MWTAYDGTSQFIFTGNSYVNRRSELVMGRGMAKQVAVRFQQLPAYFGEQITHHSQHLGEYYLITHHPTRITAFQVKRHFKDAADLELIRKSAIMLSAWAKGNPSWVYNLNFPGIGLGRLEVDQVEPLLARLPDNVFIWRYRDATR
jgi:hypothetical protein